ncbi:MAG TPA: serine--tRNA ligase [Nitrososphaeraceae archaeon]|nr:serine--tRNA ligase [Nitrososphaeraceae archaeon]
MIDPRLLRDDPERIRQMLLQRNLSFPLDELLLLDKRRRTLISQTDLARHRKNMIAQTVARKMKTKLDCSEELSEMKSLGDKILKLGKDLEETDSNFKHLIMSLPNMVSNSVPVGTDQQDNVIIRSMGTPSKFDFRPLDHVDLGTKLELFDLERAAKISGSRFYFLKNVLVKLNIGLLQFALDYLNDQGYTPVQPPYMIRREPMEGAVILEDFEHVIYKIQGEDLHMIGTSEHAIAAMHMDEILEGRSLPLRYAGISPCFRKEAGAHGKDTKGIFRVHHFDKVEQFIFTRPEDSENEHQNMVELAEKFYEKLGIPIRTVLLCTGDMGKTSSKTYDIEAWMPGQGCYREIVSSSNCLDYQSRRLRIRFRDRSDEETRLVHTLNSTLVATGRTLVAIIENFQRVDGTVEVPDPLKKFVGTDVISFQ